MLKIYAKASEGVVGREIEIKSILAAMDAGKHILLEGPPGTSKSTLLRKIAREAGIPFYIVEGNVDLTPAKLVGYFDPSRVIADSYQPEYFEKGPLTRAMEEGGILYIEEFNRMPADVSNVLITPMEEGEMSIPRYGVLRAVRPFTVISAQNPYDDVGIQDDRTYSSDQFVGASSLEGLFEVNGRGGTSHRYVFDLFEQALEEDEQISLVILLTDFYSDIEEIWDAYEWHQYYPLIVGVCADRQVPDYIDKNPVKIT